VVGLRPILPSNLLRKSLIEKSLIESPLVLPTGNHRGFIGKKMQYGFLALNAA